MQWIVVSAVLLAGFAERLVAATVQTVTVEAVQLGWYRDDGDSARLASFHGWEDNFLVGSYRGEEYRNWAAFDLRAYHRYPFHGATLRVFLNKDGFLGNRSETWTLWDVESSVSSIRRHANNLEFFADLGTGQMFGEVTLTERAERSFVEVPLNEAALTSISQAGTFWAIGGSLNTSEVDESLFLNSGLDPRVELILTIPEPSTSLLLGIGGVLLGWRRRV